MDNNEKLDILYIITLVIEKNIIEDLRYSDDIWKEVEDNSIKYKQINNDYNIYTTNGSRQRTLYLYTNIGTTQDMKLNR